MLLPDAIADKRSIAGTAAWNAITSYTPCFAHAGPMWSCIFAAFRFSVKKARGNRGGSALFGGVLGARVRARSRRMRCAEVTLERKDGDENLRVWTAKGY